MARRKVEIVESDLSGAPDAYPVTFAVGNMWHEIDVTADEEATMRDVLAPYLAAARPLGRRRNSPASIVTPTAPELRGRVRAWARGQGMEFAQVGRIPNRVLEAWNAAHPAEAIV